MSRAKGDIAESKAVDFLDQNGFTIVERNFYAKFGEIDIIAQKDSILHFIEVKSGLDYEQAIRNITPKKLSRIIRTADLYMKKRAYSLEYEIDAIVVTPYEIEYIENITL